MTTMNDNAVFIAATDTIEDIFSRFPQKAQKIAHELTRWGLQCVGCSAATWETLESGMIKHGKTTHDLEKLLSTLNTMLQEKTDLTTISLTVKAADRIKSIRDSEGIPNAALRFDEKATGCSGFEYVLDFAEEKEEDDVEFESCGIKIYVNKYSLSRLIGSQIDHKDGLESGFHVDNPNARSSCACGSSHGY